MQREWFSLVFPQGGERHYMTPFSDWSALFASTIRTEIETGRTFARVALDARDEEKIARNTANARKAYDTARAWVQTSKLSGEDLKQIAEQFEALKNDLAKLLKRSKAKLAKLPPRSD